VLLIGDRSVLGDVDAPIDRRVPEQFAERAVQSSGRGVDLDVLTELTPALAAVRGAFERWRLWRYDAVLLVVDTAAVGVRTGRDLTTLLDEVAADASVEAGVVVSLVQRARTGHGRHRQDGEAERWNRPESVDRAVVWEPMQISPGQDESLCPADVRRIAGALAEALVAPVPAGRLAQPPADAEDRRQAALHETGVLNRPQDAEFDDIVRMAQQSFGVESAELNFVDADRSWHIAVAGADRGNHPRATSYCNITIQQPGPTLIADARIDPRVRDNLIQRASGPIAFYAAYPIESIDGYRIGTLCVYDPRPRDVHEIDVSLLRDLALLAEAEIIAPTHPRTTAAHTIAPQP
jgi:hypothetical protein